MDSLISRILSANLTEEEKVVAEAYYLEQPISGPNRVGETIHLEQSVVALTTRDIEVIKKDKMALHIYLLEVFNTAMYERHDFITPLDHETFLSAVELYAEILHL